ncbi:hypothetical protein LCI01_11740 [Leuconostoc citreum]|uniref:glycosyltransferase n=1 Tax=Leuconostoc citreum TaxID=33964 RepID=UPI001170AEC4|nr:glycosyltransferase [Leuconostoc citreum]GEK61538.1 hypothetical protein LCI01_11740 [Leuconostoc citreum]
MVNCAAIIVVYNMYIDQSPSFESILKQFSPKSIFVLDNSSDEIYETHNQKIAFDFTVNYKKHSNNGLAATYNDAVKEILEDDFFSHVAFFDQDTKIPNHYFQTFTNNFDDNVDAYLPTVYANQLLMSPTIRVKKLSKVLKSVNAINSGMILRKSVFKKMFFDEQFFLDYIDHDFFKRFVKNGFKLKQLNLILYQNFSDDEANINKALVRYTTYAKDSDAYIKKYGNYYYFSFIKHTLKLTWKFKSLIFIRKLVQNEN